MHGMMFLIGGKFFFVWRVEPYEFGRFWNQIVSGMVMGRSVKIVLF